MIRRLPVVRRIVDLQLAIERWRWVRQGRGDGPLPGIEKRKLLLGAARKAGLLHVVETGTYLGDTTFALGREGLKVTSIELQPQFVNWARRRFARMPNVTILQGDSGALMPKVVSELRQPALFWLDGHYSGGVTARGAADTPIEAEVNTILERAPPGSRVFIDDARCFGSDPAYPAMQAWLDRLRARGVHDVRIAHDMIEFEVPPRAA